MTHSFDNLVWVAVVAVGLSMILRSRGVGTALPLLAVGVVIGLLPVGPQAPAAPELIQSLVLAPLVFGEALSSSYIDLKRVQRPVLALAVGLVAASTLIVGAVTSSVVPAMPVAMAIALGAVLAPTDAVAVATAARRANLPPRLVAILEGESLVNDGTGLTALRVATVAAVAGTVTVAEAGLILLQSVIVAGIVGGLAGWALILVIRHSSDVVGFGGLLLVAPFVIYIVTERFEGSAILAIVIAALMASHASHSDPTYRGRLHTAAVWRQITFILSSIAFLLLGLELPLVVGALDDAERHTLLMAVPAVVAALIITRMLFVLGAFGLTQRLHVGPRGDWRGTILVGWAGARGPVSALAAFSIPFLAAGGEELPYRDLVIAISLCVITVTLALSPTLAYVARRLRIGEGDAVALGTRVQAAMARASLAALETAETDADRDGEPMSPDVVRALRSSVERRLETAADHTAAVERLQQAADVGLAMALAEQQELLRLRTEEGIPDAIVRPLLVDLDRRIATIRAGRGAH
ncbi:MAG: Na+/H+ antiporter [Actinomycetota bacterium]|nr:Na+/H+ antiporter [Actinomycetota bacterium]